MAESFTVEAILSAVDKGFTKTMRDAESSMGGLDNNSQKTGTSIMDIAKGVGVFKLVDAGINMVKDSVGGAISRFDTLNNSTRSFENMGFTAQEVDTAMEALNKSITGLPTPLDSAISNVQLLSSSTNDLGKSEKIFAAMNNGILGFGGTTGQVDNAVMQLSQSFSNGKVDAQTWNSMINSGLGPTLSAIGKTMGKTTGELKAGLSDGSISVEEFQDSLIELNEKGGGGLKSLQTIAKDATGGIGTGLANMKTAVTRGVANIISAIDETLKEADLGSIGEVIGNIGSAFEKGLSKVAEYIPPAIRFIGKLVEVIKTVAPFLIPLVTAWGAFMIKLKGVSTVIKIFNNFKTAVTGVINTMKILGAIAAANPFVLIAGAVVGLIATFGYFMATNEEFRNKVMSVWETIKDTVMSVADFIVEKWNGMITWFSELWTTMLSVVMPFVDGLKNTFSPLIEWFSSLWGNLKSIGASAWELIKVAIMGPALLLIDLLTGDFGKFKDDFLNIWTTVKNSVTNIVKNLKDIVSGYFKALWDTAKNIFNGMKDSVIDAGNKLKTGFTNAISSMVEKVKNFIDDTVNVFNKIKEIDLWEAGKAIMDSFFKGLKEKWEAVKDFVGGIGDWIRDHKGPISYDKRLLIPAGEAIMNGLNSGLMDGFGLVQDNVSGMADSLSDAFSGNIATPSLDGLDSLMNQSMSRTINAESELLVNNSKQPLNVNLNLGKRNYSAFVEDISNEQGLQVELTMQT